MGGATIGASVITKQLDFSGLSIIFFASIIGGLFGTLVGGTSLITIPVLIFLGLPPHTGRRRGGAGSLA